MMKLKVKYESSGGMKHEKILSFSKWEHPVKLISAELILFETNVTAFDKLEKKND